MKELLKYKTALLITGLVVVVLTALTLFRVLPAIKAAKSTAQNIVALEQETTAGIAWNNPELQEKVKEIHWLEQQLSLAKSDSLNLWINLQDSVVQVHLKGIVLLESEILKQFPDDFIQSKSFGAHLHLSSATAIVNEVSNLPKKPVKKVKAPKSEDEVVSVSHDTVPLPALFWKFQTENNLEVVITGVKLNADSTQAEIPNKDIFKYRFEAFKENPFPKNYRPTLFIWLNDTDARAIYRAIPEKGKVVLH